MNFTGSPTTTRHVLVTDGDQRATLAVVRSLGAAGHTVDVCSEQGRSLAGASVFASAEHRVASALDTPDAFVRDIRSVIATRKIDTLIPMTEAALLALLPVRDSLPGVLIPFPDAGAFERISDKAAVLATARTVGIHAPAQHTLDTPADAAALDYATLQYPIVVKPARSVAGGTSETTGATRLKLSVEHAANADELRHTVERMDARAYPLLLQQRIVGPGIGIFLLLWDGEQLAAFSHRRIREKPPAGGVSVYRESIPLDDTLAVRSRALLEAFGWRGVAMVEYKVDARTGIPYLMEINGRFWGSLQLAIDAGVDFPALLLRAALGEHPSPVTAYRTDVRCRWWWGDVDHVLTRLHRSDRDLALPPGSPSRAAMLRDFFRRDPRDRSEIHRRNDRGPFFHELRMRLRGSI